MIIRRHTYDEGKITAIAKDSNYLWIAYKNATSCKLKKVSIFNPQTIFFNLTVEVDEIKRIKVSGNYIYLAIDDNVYLGAKVKSSDPWGDWDWLTKLGGITEYAIDVAIDPYTLFGRNSWFLLIPGEISGENTKIVVRGTHAGIIDLTTIRKASSMTLDENDNLWIVTNEEEAKLIKVYYNFGWQYTIWY